MKKYELSICSNGKKYRKFRFKNEGNLVGSERDYIAIDDGEEYEICFENNTNQKVQVKFLIDEKDIISGKGELKDILNPRTTMYLVKPYSKININCIMENSAYGKRLVFQDNYFYSLSHNISAIVYRDIKEDNKKKFNGKFKFKNEKKNLSEGEVENLIKYVEMINSDNRYIVDDGVFRRKETIALDDGYLSFKGERLDNIMNIENEYIDYSAKFRDADWGLSNFVYSDKRVNCNIDHFKGFENPVYDDILEISTTYYKDIKKDYII